VNGHRQLHICAPGGSRTRPPQIGPAPAAAWAAPQAFELRGAAEQGGRPPSVFHQTLIDARLSQFALYRVVSVPGTGGDSGWTSGLEIPVM
jgi:hypothetical protein